MMSSDLFAVLVIVHAGQGTIRVAIHICVYTTGVAVTSPANITLKITDYILNHTIKYIQHKSK